MSLETRVLNGVVIIRVKEHRLVFPEVEGVVSAMKGQLESGPKNLILNLAEVQYLDSPAHGCLFDLYRWVTRHGGSMKLVGLQPRVETMAGLVGLTRIVDAFPHEDAALGNSDPVHQGDDRPK